MNYDKLSKENIEEFYGALNDMIKRGLLDCRPEKRMQACFAALKLSNSLKDLLCSVSEQNELLKERAEILRKAAKKNISVAAVPESTRLAKVKSRR